MLSSLKQPLKLRKSQKKQTLTSTQFEVYKQIKKQNGLWFAWAIRARNPEIFDIPKLFSILEFAKTITDSIIFERLVDYLEYLLFCKNTGQNPHLSANYSLPFMYAVSEKGKIIKYNSSNFSDYQAHIMGEDNASASRDDKIAINGYILDIETWELTDVHGIQDGFPEIWANEFGDGEGRIKKGQVTYDNGKTNICTAGGTVIFQLSHNGNIKLINISQTGIIPKNTFHFMPDLKFVNMSPTILEKGTFFFTPHLEEIGAWTIENVKDPNSFSHTPELICSSIEKTKYPDGALVSEKLDPIINRNLANNHKVKRHAKTQDLSEKEKSLNPIEELIKAVQKFRKNLCPKKGKRR